MYQVTGIKYKPSAAVPEQDYLVFLKDCEKDDLLKLNNNGTYDYNDAGTVCSPSGTKFGTWSVTGSTLQSDGIIPGTINGYSCRELVYFVENKIIAGDKITFTLTKMTFQAFK